MRAVERSVVVAPHLKTDLQRLFKSFESFGHGWERYAEASVLTLVPRGAETEFRSSRREHVECRDGLGEQSGVAVRDAAHEQANSESLRLCGHETQGRVALEHRFLGRPKRLHLEPVIHY